jgi:hypothetical protein
MALADRDLSLCQAHGLATGTVVYLSPGRFHVTYVQDCKPVRVCE